jgi:hypothetical protein
MIAGWTRIMGHVTPVPIRSSRVASATAEHRPDEGGLSLLVDPGMEVVGDEGVLEPGLLRLRRVADEVERGVLLARKRVADRGQGVT